MNDGRPPDTSKELMQNAKGKKKKKSSPEEAATLTTDPPNPALKADNIKTALPQTLQSLKHHVSYKWSNNSCWLDTSLELLFMTATRDFDDFLLHVNENPQAIISSGVVPILEFQRSIYLKSYSDVGLSSVDVTTLQGWRDRFKAVLYYQSNLLLHNLDDLNGTQSALASQLNQ